MAHETVPLGFRFHPTDQELVGFFLKKLLLERHLLTPPYHNVIHECSLFGNKWEPSELWKKYGGPQLVDEDLYFFSELKRLTPKRMDRSVGHGGSWSETESSKLVEANGNPNPIGRKRKFRYENQGSEEHTAWLLDEYSLFGGPKNNYTDRSYDFDFVICRMRKNERVKETNLKRSSQDQEQKRRSTNKKMKKDHQMGSTESSSHVQQGCYSSLTGGELVCSYDVDPIDSTFDVEQLLSETQVEEACSPGNFENYVVSYDVFDPTTFDIGETQVEEAYNPSNFENYVVSYDVFDPTTFDIAETQVEEACNPSHFENVGNQSLADCQTGADLVVSEDVDPTTFDTGETQVEACNPSNFENCVVSYDVFDPKVDIGETQVEEACNPCNFENVGNQSLADCLTGADLVLSGDVDPTTFDIGET